MIDFIFHLFNDCPERIPNFSASQKHIREFVCGCHISVAYEGANESFLYDNNEASGPTFRTKYFELQDVIHRTRLLNEMTKSSKSEIIGIWDADVIIPYHQMVNAILEIKRGTDICYPYDGRFWRMGKDPSRLYRSSGNLDAIFSTTDRGEFTNGYGGAFFANRARYIEMGMENEKIIGYGMEDSERWHRFNQLGTVKRVPGALYHLWHPRTSQSTSDHKYFMEGRNEYEKVQAMNKSQLEEYIKTWR